MSTAIQRGFIIADQQVVKLRYNIDYQDGQTTNPYLDHVFRGNSVYDPDYSLTGHQPNGYPEWVQLYDLCTVVGSSIKWEMYNGDSALAPTFCYPSRSPTFDYNTATSSLGEIPYCRTAVMQANVLAGNKWKGRNYMSTAKMMAVNPNEVKNNNLYAHNASGNPTNVWYWHIGMCSKDNSVQPLGCYTRFQLTYYVIFKQRTAVKPS